VTAHGPLGVFRFDHSGQDGLIGSVRVMNGKQEDACQYDLNGELEYEFFDAYRFWKQPKANNKNQSGYGEKRKKNQKAPKKSIFMTMNNLACNTFYQRYVLFMLVYLFSFNASAKTFSLLDSVVVAEPAKGVAKYDRDKHFGDWRDQQGCRTTRAVMLAEQSAVPVTYNPNGCSVRWGSWLDPYTAKEFENAYLLQIDHVVALRNSYYAGAHGWSGEKRCHYANYTDNPYHLLIVDGDENSKKSDYGPSLYLPPNLSYRCEFVHIVLKIKVIWQLTMTKADWEVSRQVLATCEDKYAEMDEKDLQEQRAASQTTQKACRGFGLK
jgi:hypothetical protein